MKFDAQGRELPDPSPVALPLNVKRPESLVDMMRRLIRNDVSKFADNHGAESFEEANDFEIVEEDAELHTTEYETLQDEFPHAQAPQKEPPSKRGKTTEETSDEALEEDEDRDTDRPPPRRRARRAQPVDDDPLDADDDLEEDDPPPRRARPRLRRDQPKVERHEAKRRPRR